MASTPIDRRESPGDDAPNSDLLLLRDELALEVDALERVHAGRLACRRGCHACCVDDLSVFEVEAEAIRSSFPELLERGRPHPPGDCAFLDEGGACRIYRARPYVCRTQGLPLRWVEDPVGGVERRDICPLNDDGVPIEELDASECFTLGPFEGRLASLQRAAQRDSDREEEPSAWEEDVPLRRVRLRDLFVLEPLAPGLDAHRNEEPEGAE